MIPPVQMQRYYSGIGILWKKNIDHLVTEVPDGGNRIQCVAIRTQRPILLISTYMPSKGVNDNYEAFLDCLDQLNEILIKYDDTHDLVLGEFQWRADAGVVKTFSLSQRFLVTIKTNKIFIHPNGVDATTIDYLFYSLSIAVGTPPVRRMDLLENNSDHYPISCSIQLCLERATTLRLQPRAITVRLSPKSQLEEGRSGGVQR